MENLANELARIVHMMKYISIGLLVAMISVPAAVAVINLIFSGRSLIGGNSTRGGR